jgi:hypothetical protein
MVAKWLGNTQAVAMRHYVDVTDADFKRVIADDARRELKKRRKKRRNRNAPGLVAIRTRMGERRKKPPFCKVSRLPAIPCKTGGWRRRESNPRPAILQRTLLRV